MLAQSGPPFRVGRWGSLDPGYEPHPSCDDLFLNRSELAKKGGHNIPKNRCRTTIAERVMEQLAELPLTGDQAGAVPQGRK
jgi:hypothetical protein